MDVKDIISNIPPIEKILGAVWILSWILAIWAYHIQFFLTGVFCLFLIIIILGYFDKNEEETTKIPIVFSMNKNTNTLKVQKLYEDSIKWEDNEICSGDAILPTGVIKEGDTITNCKGNLALRHVPSNTLLGGYNFEESK